MQKQSDRLQVTYFIDTDAQKTITVQITDGTQTESLTFGADYSLRKINDQILHLWSSFKTRRKKPVNK